jgi:hypothetical protein
MSNFNSTDINLASSYIKIRSNLTTSHIVLKNALISTNFTKFLK